MNVIEEKLRAYERWHGSISDAHKLHAPVPSPVVRAFFAALLCYSEYKIAQPRHLVSHPRSLIEQFRWYVGTLETPLPAADTLESITQVLARRIVGPMHRRQVAFYDPENIEHQKIEDILEFARSQQVERLAPSSLATVSSVHFKKDFGSSAPVGGEEVVSWAADDQSTPQKPHSSAGTQPSSSANSPAKDVKAVVAQPAQVPPPTTWTQLLNLLDLTSVFPPDLLVALERTKIFTVSAFLAGKPKRRRKNLRGEGGLHDINAELLEDALDDVAECSALWWALQAPGDRKKQFGTKA